MNKLISNEWMKLFSRKRVIVMVVLALLSGLVSMAVLKVSDNQTHVRWQESYQEEIDFYNRQIASFPEFDAQEWENETSYRADLMRWNNQIQKYQFYLDNQIPNWDWRLEVLEQYFNNLLLMDCVRAGWNTDDLNRYFGYSTDIDLTQVEAQNESLMVYVLNNDYLTYNKEQLQAAEEQLRTLQEMPWVENADKTIALAENDVQMWESYVQYNAAPYARDNWMSVAIQRIHHNQEVYIENSHLSPEDPMRDEEHAEKLQSILDSAQAAVAKDRFALENHVASYDIEMDVYTEHSTYIDFLDLSVWSSLVLVLLGIVLAAFLVASEYRYDTIKQLVIYPYKRSKILAAKFRSVELLLLMMCIVLLGINLLIGFLLFPKQGSMPIFTTYFNGNVLWMPYIVFILVKYLLVLLQAWVMVSMAVMLAVITRSSSISMAISLGAYLFLRSLLNMVYTTLSAPGFLKYMLFGNLDLTQYLTNTAEVPYAPWWVSLLVIVCWWFAMRRIAYAVFKRREIRE